MMFFAIKSQNFSYIIASIAVNGFFNLSILSVSFELAVEITFPIGEAMSGGLINTVANILGFILICIFTYLLDKGSRDDVTNTLYIMGGLLISSLFIFAISKIRLKRT